MIKTIFDIVLVIAVVYAAVGVLIFFAVGALSTITGHAPDWRGAAIAGLTWFYWMLRAIWSAIFSR